jgi:hypothetical protein
MDSTPENKQGILEVAWKLYAQFDAASNKRARIKDRLNIWIAIIGLLATLFAILSSIYPHTYPPIGAIVINILLIILPILASILAAFTNKFFPGGRRLILRAGAEMVQKEIFQYRTILQKTAKRRHWLENRLREIQIQVYNGLNGEMILEPYAAKLPPGYDGSDSRSDPGFNDLTVEEYFNFRVKDQLDWHVKKVNRIERQRIFLQALILLSGGVGAFLAAMGGSFSIWVAFATALTTALLGRQEILNLDKTVRNYSKVILELTTISNHWNNLEKRERSTKEFFRIVQATETLLWSQNVDYIRSMQEVLESSKSDEADLINKTISQSDSSGHLTDSSDQADSDSASIAANELLTPLPAPDADAAQTNS